jgi:hypothetical protein
MPAADLHSQEFGRGSSLHAAVLLLTSLTLPDKLLLQTAARPWLASKPLDLEVACSHCMAELQSLMAHSTGGGQVLQLPRHKDYNTQNAN